MKPIVDHIQITVGDLERALPFYDKMLAILGFDVENKLRGRVEKHDFDVAEYVHPLLTIGINSPRREFAAERTHRRKPGSLHHLAFRAQSREEVDDVHVELVNIGAEIVGGPQLWPEHGANYYAVFFKDTEGIKYEVVYDSDSR